MTTVEAPVINAAPAMLQGMEEIIYASVEKALETFMAKRRSQRRGKHYNGKDLPPHHRFVRGEPEAEGQSEAEEAQPEEGQTEEGQTKEGEQLKFRGPWGHHGMKHGHHGMMHGHPGMKQFHHGMKQFHHGMKQGLQGMRHGHHGMGHGHHGMRHGHHGMRHGHHGMRHGHHGMRHGHRGMRCGQRFSFLACGAKPAEQQKEGEDKPVEVVDLVEQEDEPSAEGELQKGIENMNVDDNAAAAAETDE